MNTTVKLDTTAQYPVRFAETQVAVSVKVSINKHYHNVDGVYNLLTGTFSARLIDIWSIEQFAAERKMTTTELNQKIERAFKQGLKAISQ